MFNQLDFFLIVLLYKSNTINNSDIWQTAIMLKFKYMSKKKIIVPLPSLVRIVFLEEFKYFDIYMRNRETEDSFHKKWDWDCQCFSLVFSFFGGIWLFCSLKQWLKRYSFVALQHSPTFYMRYVSYSEHNSTKIVCKTLFLVVSN